MMTLADFMRLPIDEKKAFLDNLSEAQMSHVNTSWKNEFEEYLRDNPGNPLQVRTGNHLRRE